MTMEPYEHALKYIGVPFRHRGRSRPSPTYTGALDCLGLLVMVAEDLGLPYKDKKVYGREPWKDGLRKGLQENCGPPVKRPLRENDIVLFRHKNGEEPAHVGITFPYPSGGLGLIHTSGEHGRVVKHRIDARRFNLIVEAYEWPAKS